MDYLKCRKCFTGTSTVITETFDLLNGYILRNTVSIDLLKENPPEKNQEDFSFRQGCDKPQEKKEITQPVKQIVTLEQALKIKQAGIPFAIMGEDNKNVVAIFDKSNSEKVKKIINPSVKKSRGR